MERKLLIDALHPEEIRVAVIKDDQLESFESELKSRQSKKGNVYLGRVMRVEPALQAVFVDYGGDRHGFLPLSEIHPQYWNNYSISSPDADPKIDRKKLRIQDLIQPKQSFPVQILKDARHTKGVYLTTYINILGRYCILMPNSGHRTGGVSRRIDNQDRKRLKQILGEIILPEDMAIILRTAVETKSKADIRRDLNYLMRIWRDIYSESQTKKAPSPLYIEANFVHRAIRDTYKQDMDQILIAGTEAYKSARFFMRKLMNSHTARIHFYKDSSCSLFKKFDIEDKIENLFQACISLPSGGSLIIHTTETLTSIDVNSGKSMKEKNTEETALATNLEAADAVAFHARLRDLSGIVVVDFIDMALPDSVEQVEKRLKEAFKEDRCRLQLSSINEFGLFEFARQRVRPPLWEYSSQECAHCSGLGRIRVVESVGLSVLRTIENRLSSDSGIEKLTIYVKAGVEMFLLNEKRDFIVELEKKFLCRLHILKSDVRDDCLLEATYAR